LAHEVAIVPVGAEVGLFVGEFQFVPVGAPAGLVADAPRAANVDRASASTTAKSTQKDNVMFMFQVYLVGTPKGRKKL